MVATDSFSIHGAKKTQPWGICEKKKEVLF